MFDWWRERRLRRAAERVARRAILEREFNETAEQYAEIAFATVRRVAEPLVTAGVAEYSWQSEARILGLLAVPSRSLIVEAQVLWPAWKDLPQDFHGTITIRGGNPLEVREVHAYDPVGRDWNVLAANVGNAPWAWDRELEDCLRQIVQR